MSARKENFQTSPISDPMSARGKPLEERCSQQPTAITFKKVQLQVELKHSPGQLYRISSHEAVG